MYSWNKGVWNPRLFSACPPWCTSGNHLPCDQCCHSKHTHTLTLAVVVFHRNSQVTRNFPLGDGMKTLIANCRFPLQGWFPSIFREPGAATGNPSPASPVALTLSCPWFPSISPILLWRFLRRPIGFREFLNFVHCTTATCRSHPPSLGASLWWSVTPWYHDIVYVSMDDFWWFTIFCFENILSTFIPWETIDVQAHFRWPHALLVPTTLSNRWI